MKIFLIGFMGCGKSRKGRELAAKLGWHFLDLDKEIERSSGMPINQYFDQFGEQSFRKLEAETLRSITSQENVVVATGGGVPCFGDNMEWMNATGTTVYLKMTSEALVSRLGNRKKRPLIKDFNDQQLFAFIEKTLAERSEYYQRAHYTVEGLNLVAGDLVELLNLKQQDH